MPACDNLTATAVIAYFNAGVECEFLCQYQEAARYYEIAMSLSRKGPESSRAQMEQKIQRAINLCHMKVRDKVILTPLVAKADTRSRPRNGTFG